MRPPTKEELRRERERQESRDASGRDFIFTCLGSHHPRPRFYKHHFWVFTEDSPAGGDDFLWNDEYRRSGHEADRYIERCQEEGKVAFIYLSRHPRRGDDTPFNPDAERWKNAEWAPPYDKDPDPTYGQLDWK